MRRWLFVLARGRASFVYSRKSICVVCRTAVLMHVRRRIYWWFVACVRVFRLFLSPPRRKIWFACMLDLTRHRCLATFRVCAVV